jgi:hypothetical protein
MAKNFSFQDKSALFPLQIKFQFLKRIFKNQRVDCLISSGTDNARQFQISKVKNKKKAKNEKPILIFLVVIFALGVREERKEFSKR